MNAGPWSLLAGLALLCLACDDSGTGPEAPADYLPLSVGNTWTYAPEDPFFGEPFRWRVLSRQDDTVTLERPAEGSHPGPVRLIDRGDGIDLLVEGGEAAPYYRFTEGTMWVHADPWECDDGSTWIAARMDGPIQTPAGTFMRALRLDRRSSATCTDAGTMTEWWVRGVGLVRWQELNFYGSGPITFELLDYSVQGD